MAIPEQVRLALQEDQRRIFCNSCVGTGFLMRVQHECTFVGTGLCEPCGGKGYLDPEDQARVKAAGKS